MEVDKAVDVVVAVAAVAEVDVDDCGYDDYEMIVGVVVEVECAGKEVVVVVDGVEENDVGVVLVAAFELVVLLGLCVKMCCMHSVAFVNA